MFPHELSGGMKQRVCIAIAICLQPKVIIADEPTSALDVVVQRQVMETLRRRAGRSSAPSVILVGHDMGLMAQFVDRLGVMYAGKLVEVGAGRARSSDEPLHPYTQLLIASLPSLDEQGRASRASRACRRRCSTRRAAARSTRAARTRWTAAGPRCRRCARCGPDRWAACHLLRGERAMTALLEARNVTQGLRRRAVRQDADRRARRLLARASAATRRRSPPSSARAAAARRRWPACCSA